MNSKVALSMVVVAILSVWGTLTVTGRSTSVARPAVTEGQSAKPTESEKPQIPGLKLASARTGQGWNVIKATGKVVVPPENLVKVGPRVEGRIVSARCTVGEQVRRGQILAVVSSMDLAEARSSYRRAVSRLSAANAALAREKRYSLLGDASNRPVEEARLGLFTAQSELSEAQSDLIVARTDQSRAATQLSRAGAQLQRTRTLFADQIVSRQDLEQVENDNKICELDAEEAKSKVAQVQTRIRKLSAEVEIAKSLLVRQQKVRKAETVDQRNLQSMQADVSSACLDVEAARDRIRILGAGVNGNGDGVAVICPKDGRVVSRQTNVGQMVSPDSVLYEIADMSKVWIETSVYEKDLATVKLGQPIEASVLSYPSRLFSGRIQSIGDILDPVSRTATIRCEVRNDEGLLRGGMLADTSIVITKHKGAVLIPKVSVIEEAGESFVYVACDECEEDKTAGSTGCGAYDKKVVEMGTSHGIDIEILSGLAPGTQVVVVGQHQLKAAYGSGKLTAGCTDSH
jgi:cobalt-zinc-cadmium efflux system membrane fusion protein